MLGFTRERLHCGWRNSFMHLPHDFILAFSFGKLTYYKFRISRTNCPWLNMWRTLGLDLVVVLSFGYLSTTWMQKHYSFICQVCYGYDGSEGEKTCTCEQEEMTPTKLFFMWVINSGQFNVDAMVERASTTARISSLTMEDALTEILENILHEVNNDEVHKNANDLSPHNMEFIHKNGTVVSGEICFPLVAASILGYTGNSVA